MWDMSSTEGAENAIKVEFSIEGLAAIPMMITGHWSLMYFKKISTKSLNTPEEDHFLPLFWRKSVNQAQNNVSV